MNIRITPTVGVRRRWRRFAEWLDRRIHGLTHRHVYRLVETNWMLIENHQHEFVYRKRFDLYECAVCGVTKTVETIELSK